MSDNHSASAAAGGTPGPLDARTLMERLRPIQEEKGYFFNRDTKMALDILEQLLAARARYGYMACPCRLASGERSKDQDIICPCRYREEDVAEFGSCFCGLYVSRAWNEGAVPHQTVPERRPIELML